MANSGPRRSWDEQHRNCIREVANISDPVKRMEKCVAYIYPATATSPLDGDAFRDWVLVMTEAALYPEAHKHRG